MMEETTRPSDLEHSSVDVSEPLVAAESDREEPALEPGKLLPPGSMINGKKIPYKSFK